MISEQERGQFIIRQASVGVETEGCIAGNRIRVEAGGFRGNAVLCQDAAGDHVLLAGGVLHQALLYEALAVLEVDHLLRRGEDDLQRAF